METGSTPRFPLEVPSALDNTLYETREGVQLNSESPRAVVGEDEKVGRRRRGEGDGNGSFEGSGWTRRVLKSR